jgi:hypothetical protein
MTASTKRLKTRGPVDVRIERDVSVYLFHLQTRAAQEWVKGNLGDEGHQWFGGALVVEPRFVGDLLQGLRADGLVCQ